MARPYVLTVTVTSEAEGEELQTVLCRETSATEQDHVQKNFVIARAVKDAVDNAMEQLANAGGFKTKLK